MNPLDLPGPEFLGFYLVYGVAGLAAASMARRMLAAIAGAGDGDGATVSARWSPGWFPQEADCYAIARLRGSRTETARTLLGFFLAAKLITIDKQAVKRPPGEPFASDLVPIEREGLAAIGDGLSAPAVGRNLKAAIAGRLEGLERELETAGLAWPPGRQAPFRWLRNATAAAILGLGLAKLLVATQRGHSNVEFLVIMVVLYAMAIFIVLAPPLATPAGRRYLDWLRQSHAGLLSQVANGRAVQPRQVALAAAIFGLGRVPPLVPLMVALRPPTSAGGGDTGSGCGGGGGGGGCGGGGGGGGCGGCGS